MLGTENIYAQKHGIYNDLIISEKKILFILIFASNLQVIEKVIMCSSVF